MDSTLIVIALLVGWLLDLVFGDPISLPHPIVYMGKWISFWEKRLNHSPWRMTKGALLAISSIGLTFLLVWLLFKAIGLLPFSRLFTIVMGAVCVFYCLAGKTLRREVRWVFESADRGEEEARRQVARIVGRDTSELSLQECRTAALETLAENLSDGVVAPLFWFALLGFPGMMMYKMVNTLDSMVGYHSERYLRFGCWAARIDDAFNYIPARLTALLIVLASHLPHPGTTTQHSILRQLSFVWQYGPKHASPNSGWPESALASTLNCRFGGPHYYFGEYFYKPFIGEKERVFNTQDMQCACSLNLYSEIIFILLIAALRLTFCFA